MVLSLIEVLKSSPIPEVRCSEGDIAEFGVAHGETFGGLLGVAVDLGCRCHAFDSFVGMNDPGPNDNGTYPRGRFSIGGVDNFKYARHASVKTWPGYLPGSLCGEADLLRFRFAHVDLDHYWPTLSTLRWLWPRMNPGGVVCVHDYFPGEVFHATPAVDQWAKEVGDIARGGLVESSIWFSKPIQ